MCANFTITNDRLAVVTKKLPVMTTGSKVHATIGVRAHDERSCVFIIERIMMKIEADSFSLTTTTTGGKLVGVRPMPTWFAVTWNGQPFTLYRQQREGSERQRARNAQTVFDKLDSARKLSQRLNKMFGVKQFRVVRLAMPFVGKDD